MLVLHRRAGKTVLAVVTLIDAALKTTKPRARYAYLAPMRNQAKAVAWDYIKAYATKVPGTLVNEGELHVTFPNGAQIRLYGADNPDALRGLYLDGVVMDEVAQMRPQVWGEVVRPALSDRIGWALFIGTPRGTNLFSELYHSAVSGKFGDEWYGVLMDVHATEVFEQSDQLRAELVSAKQTLSDAQYRQEYLCDFSASCDNQLITLDMVNAATARVARPERVELCPKIMGVDVARYGDDRSVIARRQGPLLHPLTYFAKIDNMELATHVARAWTEWDADVCFIDAGRGEGVIDKLRELNFDPRPVDFGGTKALLPGYMRKRDQMWGEGALWINSEACLPDDPDLRAAMTGATYSWANNKHVMELESKDSMRKRGLPSPDPADATFLTFAEPVAMPKHPVAEMIAERIGGRRGDAALVDEGPTWAH